MKIGIFGIGYVGFVISVCLARGGHDVLGVDIVQEKIDKINSGEMLIFEPGLQELLSEIQSSHDPKAGSFKAVNQKDPQIEEADVFIICVGTPVQNDNVINLNQVKETCRLIGRILREKSEFCTVVMKSTVPPGTVENMVIPVLEAESHKQANRDFDVLFHPEFLREGQAVKDYFNPSLNIVGSNSDRSAQVISSIFADVAMEPVTTSFRIAEMLKYVSNSFHALKVAFTNEISMICKSHEIDSSELMGLFCTDKKLNISSKYMRPGFAYGGSCLPKDLRGIIQVASDKKIKIPLLSSISQSNQEHIIRLVSIVQNCSGKSVGFLGGTFKPETDDLRESPVIFAIEKLLDSPTYLKGKKFYLLEKSNILAKLSHLREMGLNFVEDPVQLIEEMDILVLGPYGLDEQMMGHLGEFEGTIVDLLWHPVPESVSRLPGYQKIC